MPNFDILDEYILYLEGIPRSPETVQTAKNSITYFIRFLGDKNVLDIQKKDVQGYLAYLNKYEYVQGGETKKLADGTKYQRKSALRQFLKWLPIEYPDVPHLETVIKLNKSARKPLPSGLLTEEEVQKMIAACTNERDRAMIGFLWESGCRKGELFSVKNEDVEIKNAEAVVNVCGKTGPRRVLGVSCAQYMMLWQARHPNRDKTKSPFFCSLRKPHGKMDKTSFAELLDLLAEKAGINRKIYPHLFRHSRATDLAKNGWSETKMEIRLGWVPGSRMTGVYVHMSGEDLDDDVRRLAGVDVQEKKRQNTIILIECPRCHIRNNEDADRCVSCMTALSKKAKEEDREAEESKWREKESEMEKKMEQLIERKLSAIRNTPALKKAAQEAAAKASEEKKQNNDKKEISYITKKTKTGTVFLPQSDD